jgi:succinoglycan biosynthesis transport protein ExoP
MQLIKSTNFGPSPAQAGYQTYSEPPVNDVRAPHFGHILWAHKYLFTACVVGAMGVAALVTYSMSPIYQAKGSIELQSPPPSAYSSKDGEAAGAVNVQTYDSWIQTQIGIIESDTLLRRVVERVKLEDRLNAIHPEGLVAVKEKLLGAKPGSLTHDDAVEIARGNLKVRQSRLNNLIEILYNSEDPELAARFVNTLSEEYEQQNLESRWKMAQNTGDWLTKHIAELRLKLEASESALQSYSKANNLLLAADKESIARERLHQLQQSLSQAQSDRMSRQSQMEMAANATPDSVPQVLDNAALKEYEIKLADLARQLAEYKQIYTPNNPKMQMVQTQIASLEAAFNRTRASVLGRLRNEYEASLRNEKMLSSAYSEQARLVTDQDGKMIRYDTLKHEVDTNRSIYESLLQKVKESSVSVALQATGVRVVDSALPPGKPYKPNKAVNLAGGLLAGLLLGVTSVSLRHRSDRRVRRPGAMQRYLASRELGVIPSAGPVPARISRLGRTQADEIGVRAWLDPNSQASESFRSVMTSILFASGSPSGVRLIVITSPEAGEGKTTVASNLGAVFAATGRRVLLVDADLRRPRLNKVFDLASSPGLLEFAQEVHGRGVAARVDNFVHQTSVTGLSLMPCGTCAPGEMNLLHTLRFKEVFAALRSQFDTIVVDAPPLLCVPEVRVMARLADGVALVVRAGSTDVDEAINAERFIHQDGGTLIGTILNDAPRSSTPYYSRYVASPTSAS